MKKKYFPKFIFYLILIFSISNLFYKIIDSCYMIPYYWNKNGMPVAFFECLKREGDRIGWINIDDMDYIVAYDASFFWLRYLIFPTQLDNKSIYFRTMVKFSEFSDVLRFSKLQRMKILGVLQKYKVAVLEKMD